MKILSKMKKTESYYIEESAMAMDGGSIFIKGVTSTNKEFEIFLPQNKIHLNFTEEFLPGRLYLNQKLVEFRSSLEYEIISNLLNCKIITDKSNKQKKFISRKLIILGQEINDYFSAIEKGEEVATLYLVNSVISFVESDMYNS